MKEKKKKKKSPHQSVYLTLNNAMA